jgi:photosystem II stability/assembly factor-like uncharacterized protein
VKGKLLFACGFCALIAVSTLQWAQAQKGNSAAAQQKSPQEKFLTQFSKNNKQFRKSASAADPATGSAWSIIGPGGGGAFYTPAISPLNPNLVLASTDMTSCYISNDGGKSWRTFQVRWRCTAFAFDASDPKVIYALARTVFRSMDGGQTWSLIYPANASSVTYADDEAETGYTYSGRYQDPPRAIAADPQLPDVLYCVTGSQVLVSKDRGNSWNVLYNTTGVATSLFVDPNSPKEKRNVVVAGGAFVLFCSNGACEKQTPPETSWIYAMAAGPEAGGNAFWVYAITDGKIKNGVLNGGVLVSKDWGASWQQANGFTKLIEPGTYPSIPAISVYPHDARIVYLSYTHFRPAGDENPYLGVLISKDGGETWTTNWMENNLKASDAVKDVWVTPLFGAEWGENPLSMAVDPSNPNRVVSTDLGRILITEDGGQTWTGVYSKAVEGGGFTTTGLDVTTSYGVHIDPFAPERIFISYTDIGLWRSDDNAASWKPSFAGIPRDWRNTCYWMEFDREVQGRAWAVFGNVHDLPRYKMRTRINSAGTHGGIAITNDGGLTWRPIQNAGLPDTPATHLLIDQAKAENGSRILYATSFRNGVYKSIDNGETWAPANEGLPESKRAWRLSQASDGTLYLVMARMDEVATLEGPYMGSLWVSTDQAASWKSVTLPEGITAPHGLTPDPTDPTRLYLSAWPRYKRYDPKKATEGGVYLSTDRGHTWTHAFKGDSYIYDVTYDPTNSSILYAGGLTGSMWRSPDRGSSWARMKGFNFKLGHRVIPDPRNPEMVFITTYGNSVWYGPAQGDPNAVESIAGPPAIVPK